MDNLNFDKIKLDEELLELYKLSNKCLGTDAIKKKSIVTNPNIKDITEILEKFINEKDTFLNKKEEIEKIINNYFKN